MGFQDPIEARHEVQASHVETKVQAEALEVNAQQGTEQEHHLSIAEAIKEYPWAIFWALVVSMTVIMEGYDTILIGNFFAFPAFKRKYGVYVPALDDYQLTAPWQAGLSNASGVGAFFGTLINGYLVTKFGMKRVLLGALLLLAALITMTFQAPKIEILLVGQILCGFPWGVFATTAPAYASEMLPMSLRVFMTSWTNMCFIIGQLIAAGVLAGLVGMESEWAFRIPFAVQWVWPAFLIPILFFAPESPWHLVRVGKIEEAEKSLARVHTTHSNVKHTLAVIIHTNRLEEELEVGTSYWDCFKGTERRRTEIACVAFAGQILSGSTFSYNASYFFEQVGLKPQVLYNLNVGGTGLALFGTLINWFFIMPYFGRRRIYIIGMLAMASILFTIGFLNIDKTSNGIGMGQAVLTLVWTFVFQLSVGQLGWSYPSEIGSTRLRQKTICLARNCYSLVSIISNVLAPYFMNPTQWNLSGYTGFVWGSTSLLVALWAFFRLPEPRGRTYEEMDIMFAKKVHARKFAKYKVDLYEDVTSVEEKSFEKSASDV